ncbi:peptidoglycan editing factor PgeF [Neobacillus notoginsengisoli]|uniref:Purine nucleoside phosphorylase n=1 Tax=Neobacillus notoginsengisoli TaxID=1578198 RepID=A0A417YR07_9BACI|nr:peptidoglycan editing factor PgeF [Neobacillus notoginsengisoli]RHW36485.1 peptidoglycan editing factor PgeF [Neobacillus notoginsengisoli]
MEPFFLSNETTYFLRDWMEKHPGLAAGFSSRNGGAGTNEYGSLNTGFHVGDDFLVVQKNRRLIAETAGFSAADMVGAEQTHGIQIKKVGNRHKGMGASDYERSVKDTDGFYTDEAGVLLTMCFADCVPLYFFDPTNRMIGIAHAGWKGTVNGIGPEMVRLWKEEGIRSDNIFAAIGPSICKKCYIVDDYVISFVNNRLEHVEKKPYNQISPGQYSLDLKEMNRMLLIEAGIQEQNIAESNLCSSCSREHFFSHRRDNGKTGRMLGFIGWKEDSLR